MLGIANLGFLSWGFLASGVPTGREVDHDLEHWSHASCGAVVCCGLLLVPPQIPNPKPLCGAWCTNGAGILIWLVTIRVPCLYVAQQNALQAETCFKIHRSPKSCNPQANKNKSSTNFPAWGACLTGICSKDPVLNA